MVLAAPGGEDFCKWSTEGPGTENAKRCQDFSRCHGLCATLPQGWGHLSERPVIMRGGDHVPWRLAVPSSAQTAVRLVARAV